MNNLYSYESISFSRSISEQILTSISISNYVNKSSNWLNESRSNQ